MAKDTIKEIKLRLSQNELEMVELLKKVTNSTTLTGAIMKAIEEYPIERKNNQELRNTLNQTIKDKNSEINKLRNDLSALKSKAGAFFNSFRGLDEYLKSIID